MCGVWTLSGLVGGAQGLQGPPRALDGIDEVHEQIPGTSGEPQGACVIYYGLTRSACDCASGVWMWVRRGTWAQTAASPYIGKLSTPA